MKAAVIGSPISHSLSPLIFNFIAHEEGHIIAYQAIEVKAIESNSFLQELRKNNDFLGLNITLPLKELFLKEIDFISPEVKALGALNVLHFDKSGIRGFNTDIIGIQKTFEDKKFSVEGKNCFLIGAGGAAKAVAYVLGILKARNVFILNRSERVRDLVNAFANIFPDTKWIAVNTFEDEQVKKTKIDLIINSTPLGMTGKDSGQEFFKPIAKLIFSSNALAFDLIYTPEQTDFLQISKSRGLATVGGLGMLIDQAIATWKIWIGDLKNEKELHFKLVDFLNGVLEIRQNEKAIYLTGFMGVGKSSVGEELALLVERKFLDTDMLIETEASLSITEIFALKGEAYFRNLESDTVLKLSRSFSKNAVVALGGGAIINHESFHAVTRSGALVYLSAKEQTLIERITKQDQVRPILTHLSLDEKGKKISKLLKLRKEIYQKADIEIKTDNLNIRDIAYEIIIALGKMKGGHK